MRFRRVIVLTSLVPILAIGCRDATIEVATGVPRSLADRRAATISRLRYNIELTVPDERSEPVRGREIVTFTVSQPGAVVFDFAQAADRVLGVSIDGQPVAYRVHNEHVVLPPGVVAPGDVAIEIDFLAGDGSLNRQDTFLYTLFVPDRARVAFPVFDQPNLKAVFGLRLVVPAAWRAVSNGAIVEHEVSGSRAVFRFADTRPISSYLFSFVAGEFEVEVAERAGRRMVMYHRETDREKVERNRDAIFDLHAVALEWLETYTGIPYPFEKFDFVLVPSFQYGGMEHPGAIQYRAASLLLDESATQNQLLGRASVIAHETAHQWFGDLVTMEWFDDVWMKEVFANFMAAKIVNPSFPDVDHELRFLLAHYPAAYEVDRTAGANPIRQSLENLNQAGTLYGAIIYQKAPVMMQHLERLVGETAFRDGLREYLNAHRYGNATWSDLIAILDRLTDEDLAEWSAVWIESSGRPHLAVEIAVSDGRITALSVRQSDPAGAGRLWTQRVDLLLGYRDGAGHQLPVSLRQAETAVPGGVGLPAPDFVLANGRGVGYGHMVLDEGSRAHLLGRLPTLVDPMTRAVAWISLYEGMLDGAVDPDAFVDLARRALPAEGTELIVQRMLAYLTSAYWRYLTPERRSELAGELEELLWRLAVSAPVRSLASSYFGAYRDVALTPSGVQRLTQIWRGTLEVPDLPLSERDYSALAQELALRQVADADSIVIVQRDRIDNPDRRAGFEFVIPALSGDPAVRQAFFESLADPANREREPWVLLGLGFLHHPLRGRDAERYIRPGLELLEEIQRTGDIFFPTRWLDATLGGHQTAAAADLVRAYLDEHPDLPPRLRGKVLQSADGLFRAARIVAPGESRIQNPDSNL